MKKGLLTSLFILLFITSISGQSRVDWKYEAYPDLPFQLNNIDLELTVETKSSLIKGIGIFTVTSRRPDLTKIIFNTSDLDIKEVSVNGNALEFQVNTDSLIIQLADTLTLRQSTEFLISWESSSPFGIHTDAFGHLWTSLNPGTRHHWLPIPDHPEVQTTINASFTIAADHEVVFNGSLTGDEVVSAEEKKVQFSSETPVPVSGITFATGIFQRESARSGVKEVAIYASENALLENVRSGLLSVAVKSLKEYEGTFSFEFPYEALNIVVLPDNKWEEIQSGAGIIYLYQNLGSLSTQLKRGIAEQWLGNYHRYLNAPDSRYEFLKALVTEADDTEQLLNPDNLQSIKYWNKWERGIASIQDDFLKTTIQESLAELIQEFKGVTSWNDYADFWYDKTGAFWNDLPDPGEDKNQQTKKEYVYNVEYAYDEMDATLTLFFEAQSEPIGSLVSVDLMQYGFTDTTQSEISFTGALDSVSVDLLSGVDYVTLDPKTDLNVALNEQKPFIFLIRQLRSSNAEEKIQAARQLRNYTDNPDLQLALQDVLEGETEPEVRAAMLATLAEITKGASGTEQNFLDQLNSENLATRLSAIRALSGYPENEQVRYAIRNVIIRSEMDTVFTAALDTYRQLAEAEDLIALTERLEKSEGGTKKTMEVLEVAAQADTSKQSISIADRFALGDFPYSIRKQALDILLKYENNQDYWNQTIEMLLTDRDPRIRFHALDAIKYLSAKKTVDVLKDRLKEEMDPRVAGKIRSIM